MASEHLKYSAFSHLYGAILSFWSLTAHFHIDFNGMKKSVLDIRHLLGSMKEKESWGLERHECE